MEIRYPDFHSNQGYGPAAQHAPMVPNESQSTPALRKTEQKTGQDKFRKGRELKKVDIESGVKLEKPRKKRKSKFHIESEFTYPGVIAGHKHCVTRGPPVPARNGWAWKSTLPEGMKVGTVGIQSTGGKSETSKCGNLCGEIKRTC